MGFYLFAKVLRRASRDQNGSVALMMGILLPVLAFTTLATVDYVNLTRHRMVLQEATDAAALSAVQEMRLLDTVEGADVKAGMTRVARGILEANLPKGDWTLVVDANSVGKGAARVDSTLDAEQNFLSMFGVGNASLEATAVAELLGGEDVCAVALSPTDTYMFDLNNDSRIVGAGCAIYSNSDHANGLSVSENGKIEAGQICSAGGASGSTSAYEPPAVTDCPPLEDPLTHKLDAVADVAKGPCVSMAEIMLDGAITETLSPGRYCYDVEIVGDVELEMQPGIFVFDNAVFTVAGRAKLKGEDVALVFTDDNSRMVLGGDAMVNLGGRLSGDMAGLLMISEPRSDGTMREFTITSPNVRELVGTIYLPGDYLNILTNDSVAEDSAFTVVMAKRIKLHGSASLVLNRDYATTSVPKDGALSQYNGGLRLIE